MKLKDVLISILTAMTVSAGTALAINPPFSTAWNAGYEAIPADTEQESLGASRIRDLKVQLRQRLSQDMSWNGDGNDGYHNHVTLLQQTQPPVPTFDLGATGGELFTENVNGEAELLYADNQGHTTQLTSNGGTPQTVPAGSVSYYAGPTTPAGYLLANGQAVSRTSFSNLFANIGTTYGNGDGTTTFNLPDCRARYVAGGDASDATGRLTGLTGGVNASTLGNVGGSQQFTLQASNIPPIPVTVNIHDPGHTHTLTAALGGAGSVGNGGGNIGNSTITTNSATTGITADGTANNGVSPSGVTAALPPTIVFNCIIKTDLEMKNAPEDFLPDTYAQADPSDGERPEPTLPSSSGLFERHSILSPKIGLC